MATKFRIYFKKFNLTPEHMETIVLATTVLHNFLRNDACSWHPGELEANEPHDGLQDLPNVGCNFQEDSFIIVDTLSASFSSAVGSVSWQEERVNWGLFNQS